MKSKSVRYYLLLSWLLPLFIAVGVGGLLSLSISYLDYSNYRQSLQNKLHADGNVIARRVAAEMLLKSLGRTEAVLQNLRAELKLANISVSTEETPNSSRFAPVVTIQEEVPGVTPRAFVVLSTEARRFSEFLNLRNLLLALIPVCGLVLFGFLIQRRLLRRFILRPIEALSETSVGARPVRTYWPTEIQTIAKELSVSFSKREQAIFGQLARGLIHDIRTHINSIHTALQLVQESRSDEDRAARRERLERACERNVAKLKDLLELSLDSSREITLRPQQVDISATVQSSITNIHEMAEAKGVSLIAANLESVVLSHDSIQLERVFTNLIKNAVEAAEVGSASAPTVVVSSELANDRLIISIEDTGPGFSDYEQAFRPLTSTKTHGYGLGLFVSKKIVQAHHGELHAAASTRTGGAKITVELPRKEASA